MNKYSVFIAVAALILASGGCSVKPKEEAKEPQEVQEITIPVKAHIQEQTVAEVPETPEAPEETLTALIPQLGLAIDLPAGWKQGRILLHNEDKFKEEGKGNHFFADPKSRYPYGSVTLLPQLPDGLSLDQYASGISFNETVSKTAKSLAGRTAVEIVEEDIDAFEPGEQTLITALHLYIQDKKGLIWLSYWTESQDFETYQAQLRKSLDSVVLTRR
jgi:hypothetical protein